MNSCYHVFAEMKIEHQSRLRIIIVRFSECHPIRHWPFWYSGST